MQNRVGFKHLEKRWRCSVVEEPQAGVHQSDALLITGIDHNLVSSRARWSCDVLNTTLQTDTEGKNVSKDGLLESSSARHCFQSQ